MIQWLTICVLAVPVMVLQGCGFSSKFFLKSNPVRMSHFDDQNFMPRNEPDDLVTFPFEAVQDDIKATQNCFSDKNYFLGKSLLKMEQLAQEMANYRIQTKIIDPNIARFPRGEDLESARLANAGAPQNPIGPENSDTLSEASALFYMSKSAIEKIEPSVFSIIAEPDQNIYEFPSQVAGKMSRSEFSKAKDYLESKKFVAKVEKLEVQFLAANQRNFYSRSLHPSSMYQYALNCVELKFKFLNDDKIQQIIWPRMAILEQGTTQSEVLRTSFFANQVKWNKAQTPPALIPFVSATEQIKRTQKFIKITETIAVADGTRSGEKYQYFRESSDFFLTRFSGTAVNPTQMTSTFASVQNPANKLVFETTQKRNSLGSTLSFSKEQLDWLSDAYTDFSASKPPYDSFTDLIGPDNLDQNCTKLGSSDIDFGKNGIHYFNRAAPESYVSNIDSVNFPITMPILQEQCARILAP